MTDIENHWVDGPVDEYEGDEPAESEIDSEILIIKELLDNDDVISMICNSDSSDFDIDFGDAIREALFADESLDEQRSPIERMLIVELRRQIREQAEEAV